MKYLHARTRRNYEDYASGRVIYNVPGAAPFPVRLADEIFMRCASVLKSAGVKGPYTVYDPFSGSGYLLTVLGFLHYGSIRNIVASDIDQEMLVHARRNLGLLQAEGLQERLRQLETLHKEFGRDSHAAAAGSACRLLEELQQRRETEITWHVFYADALSGEELPIGVDIIIADFPYGSLTSWAASEGEGGNTVNGSAAGIFLGRLAEFMSAHCVAAVIADKGQKLRHAGLKRVEHFNLGRRHIALFTKNSSGGEIDD